ncbi:MAG: beta-galactosidase, partial [Kiritimatiellae bacterium]|nr:beta-galactosidase [Kiritimatiellia bacterium]
MKTIATMMALAASLAAMAEEREIDGREWQDNQRLELGREPMRAAFSSFPDEKAALRILPEYAPRQLSLDSDSAWRFSWARNPDERQKEFYREDFDDSLWPTIRVPCSWQATGARNGKGGWGTPIYTNQSYPFAKDVPGGSSVMLEPPKYFTAYDARNPVGSYRRHFKVPAKWDGSDIFLKFDGVDSFFYL